MFKTQLEYLTKFPKFVRNNLIFSNYVVYRFLILIIMLDLLNVIYIYMYAYLL